jgi:carboxyl-terminal processing protease
MKIILTCLLSLGFGFGVLPALNGCGERSTSMERFSEAVGLDPYRTTTSANRELQRFNTVFALYSSDPGDSRQLKHFRDGFKRIRSSYVESIDDAVLIDAAIEGVTVEEPKPGSLPAQVVVGRALDAMTASLDPHSDYLDPQELSETEMITSGRFGGLGIQVTEEEGLIKVIAPIDGTPAARAGLRTGDKITHLDGQSVQDLSLRESVNYMRGEPGTPIQLTIDREAQPPFDVTIVRAIIVIEPVRWRVEGDIGYIRVVSFSNTAAENLETAIREIRDEVGDKLAGLVLDLRNNPGGLLDQSLAVADMFLVDGTIVSVRGRDGERGRAFSAGSGEIGEDIPVVVLINRGSASASEIVAAALRDHDRATVIGTRSFGKGTVQTMMRLPEEGALKLTTALYYGPNGRTIQAKGVEPNIVLTGGEPIEGEMDEAHLPNAISAEDGDLSMAQASIDVETCVAIGENEDRPLGCAIDILHAGSAEGFLATRGVSPKL